MAEGILPAVTEALPRRFGRFDLVERVSTGGMGEVFRAQIPGSTRWFALKRLPPDAVTDPMLSAMFVDEARMAAAVQGRHVAHLVEHDEVDGQHFLVFDWIEGVTLEELLHKLVTLHRPLAVDQTAQLFAELAEALEELHQTRDPQGRLALFVHRDVSPSNIVIDLDGSPHLVDYGLSKSRLQLQKTHPGFVKGKFGYIAPEQLAGAADVRTDIFALGLCFYETLTGERLFERPTIDASAEALKRFAGIPSVRPLRPDLPEALDEVVCKMLAPNPDDRYATAADVKKAIVGAMPGLLLSGEDLEEATGALVERLFPSRMRVEKKPTPKVRPIPVETPSVPGQGGLTLGVMGFVILAILAAIAVAYFSRG